MRIVSLVFGGIRIFDFPEAFSYSSLVSPSDWGGWNSRIFDFLVRQFSLRRTPRRLFIVAENIDRSIIAIGVSERRAVNQISDRFLELRLCYTRR